MARHRPVEPEGLTVRKLWHRLTTFSSPVDAPIRWSQSAAFTETEPHGRPSSSTRSRGAADERSLRGGDSGVSVSPHAVSSRRGAHRRPTPRPGGRIIAVSVAAGAVFAAATSTAHASPTDAHSLLEPVTDTPDETIAAATRLSATPQVLQSPQVPTFGDFADQLDKARARAAARVAREAEARRPKTMMPVSGTLTSNFGPRWGTTHYGLDIANAIGTPIVSVTDGTVIEAGPASGFGLWVRILQDDGTIGVFGHIDQALVTQGQRVRAGEQIATVGNRGQSTGPHLHYEVWHPDGRKADPMAWLNARGLQVVPDIRS